MKTEPIYMWNIRFRAVIGIGVWVDRYTKERVGMDGYQYYIVMPFLLLTFSKIYPPNLTH